MMSLDSELDLIFTPSDLHDEGRLRDLFGAVYRCVSAFLETQPGKLHLKFQVDEVQMMSFLSRFQRDAFGVAFFEEKIQHLVDSGEVSKAAAGKIMEALDEVSIRINSPSPRKTRIAAAFSLWMSACRPIYFGNRSPNVDLDFQRTIPGRINFFIASTFLSKFGTISLGSGEDAEEREKRIYYDLTFREVNLSSLEVFYCSILRTTESP